MKKNRFRHSVEDANAMVRKNKPEAKQPKRNYESAAKMAGVRLRIQEGDNEIVRGYKKSRSNSPFSKELPPKKEVKEPKRLSADERLARIVAEHSTDPWQTLTLKQELRTEKRKAELKREMAEAEEASDGKN